MCCMPPPTAFPTLHFHTTNTHKQQQLPSMDIPSCLKASLLALSLLSMATWLPHMYSSFRTFFLVSLPAVASAVVAPKCLFVFSNIIVVFLISESKLSQSGSSESLNAGEHNGELATAEGDRLQRQKEGVAMEGFLPIIEEISKQEDTVVVEQDEDTVVVCEAVVQMDQLEQENDAVFCDQVDETRGEVQEEDGGDESMVEDQRAEELEERDLPPADELNRRVEDFIARFNMERQLEARMLVCCC